MNASRKWVDLLQVSSVHAIGGSTLGSQGHSPPKSWLGPPNLALLLTHCGQLILRKIRKIDAIRCQFLKANNNNNNNNNHLTASFPGQPG